MGCGIEPTWITRLVVFGDWKLEGDVGVVGHAGHAGHAGVWRSEGGTGIASCAPWSGGRPL
eukprot:scaffold64976_cov28-Tisochrysis_lutea.AAC.1